ncbi:MAG TPA: hypothetical protein PK771_11750 [Spirochaetota bacterium]|nr:hypothetical protein [Spirochaetota bacterium]
MNFQIPIVGGIITFVLVFILNLIGGNSFGLLLIRSLITGGLVFGILFGVIYVLKDILKIDFNTTESSNPEENKVDISVDDETLGEVRNSEGFSDDGGGGGDDELSDGDVSFSESNESGEFENDEKLGLDNSSFEDTFSTPSNSKENKSLKDILGYEASTEDLAKAIKTKLSKDE